MGGLGKVGNGLSTIAVYNGIYKLLSNDAVILQKLGLPPTPTNEQKGRKIQKRSKPQELSDNLPIITYYTPGGNMDIINQNVYKPLFYFDIYTKDNVNLAHEIAERIFELFDGVVNCFPNLENAEASFIDAHESDPGQPNVYCFTLEILFSIAV